MSNGTFCICILYEVFLQINQVYKVSDNYKMILLSPSKSMSANEILEKWTPTIPYFEREAIHIRSIISKMPVEGLQKLMKLSPKLALETKALYQLTTKNKETNYRNSAIVSYTGDVYLGLDAKAMHIEDVEYAQNHLLIFSAMYGVLRPKDAISPYRLDMQTPLKVKEMTLYQFWKDKILQLVLKDIKTQKTKLIFNLASKEYAKMIEFSKLPIPVVNFEFYEEVSGERKMVSVFSKKARGLMASFIIKNKIEEKSDLIKFNLGGYLFDVNSSTAHNLVFYRSS